MLEKLGGTLVEVVGELDLATQRSERVRYGSTLLHGHEPGDRTSRALDHDLFAAFGELDELGQLALRFVHAYLDHAGNRTRLS